MSNSKMKLTYSNRHGDVNIFKNADVPADFQSRSVKSLKLALGEVSGHSHAIYPVGEGSEVILHLPKEREKVTDMDLHNMDELIYSIKGQGVLVHEEHEPQILEEGTYSRTIQAELNPFTRQLEKVRD